MSLKRKRAKLDNRMGYVLYVNFLDRDIIASHGVPGPLDTLCSNDPNSLVRNTYVRL